jgi:uncharacterized membrane protein YjgN (DUF898 family)
LTGVVLSFALKQPLAKAGFWVCFGLGLLALPVGAFAFGVLASLVENLTATLTDITDKFGGNPFSVGVEYALFSVVSLFAVVLFPLAVLTTFLLRAVIRFNRKSAR